MSKQSWPKTILPDFTSIRLVKGTFTLELSNMLGTHRKAPEVQPAPFF
jgi:hypothetical protein